MSPEYPKERYKVKVYTDSSSAMRKWQHENGSHIVVYYPDRWENNYRITSFKLKDVDVEFYFPLLIGS